jgi:hypothetical protein
MTDLGIEANLDPEIEEQERKKERGETTMKLYLTVFAALAMSLMSSALVPSLKASESDKKTTITISQPLAVEGMILPAGQYVFKLLDSATVRDVVYIFNGDETQLITTIIAIHTQRLQVTDKTEFSFYDSPAGEATALRAWFYPGDDTGFLFRQAQQTAGTLAAAGKAPKRSYQHTAAAGSSAGGAD